MVNHPNRSTAETVIKNYRYEFANGDSFPIEAGDDHSALRVAKMEACRRTDAKLMMSNAVFMEKMKILQNGVWLWVV